ncbi:hypothetical protein DM02DRAFT_576718 [Periconia macrospinosa]|uniref:Zn(2)-C6 fungal-type domain-containing protein n=1 Tax=Periconia macrospinosa TaxID=97972 RepID=A0A2V1D148_9PLEO|nr:hypothetical protein DM02DRAFT_576718 [Periconia macrospinosa]
MSPRTPVGKEPNTKRRKVSIACERCRSRKARCDGNKPVCSSCSARSEQCIYKVSSVDAEQTNEYVEMLVNRITQLERELDCTRNVSSANLTGPGPAASVIPDRTREDTIEATPGPVDAMGASTCEDDSPDVSQKFYGSSSALSFMRQMYTTILGKDHIISSRDARASPSQSCSAASTASLTRTTAPEHFSLFPRHLADQLMSLYWNRVYVLYPFVHRESFNKAYEDLWKPSASHRTRDRPGLGLGSSIDAGPSSVVFHCAYNAALALGMQFSDISIEEKDKLSSICLEKSKNLLKLDLFEEGSISLVQTLLLLTQYFQSMNIPNKCWTSIGVACRLAQGLGLHLEDGHFLQPFDSSERELRKRVWHGCVTLDTTVSMTLGRPGMLIGDLGRSLPEAVDNDDWVSINGEQSNKASIIEFFSEAIKLSQILGRILLNVYRLNDQRHDKPEGSDGYTSFDVLIELDEELSQYANRLPSNLCWTHSNSSLPRDSAGILLRQSHVLHVRFLHSRMLLYRPIFFQFCRRNSRIARLGTPSSSGPAVVTSLAFHCALTCVQTAVELIGSIEKYSCTAATGAYWYNMFYTRSAAMVVLLGGISPSIHESIGNNTWDFSWVSCCNILTRNLPQYPSVKMCLTTLEALHHHVLRYQAQAEMDPIPALPIGPTSSMDMLQMLQHKPAQNQFSMDSERTLSNALADQFILDNAFDPAALFEDGLFPDLGSDSINPMY